MLTTAGLACPTTSTVAESSSTAIVWAVPLSNDPVAEPADLVATVYPTNPPLAPPSNKLNTIVRSKGAGRAIEGVGAMGKSMGILLLLRLLQYVVEIIYRQGLLNREGGRRARFGCRGPIRFDRLFSG